MGKLNWLYVLFGIILGTHTILFFIITTYLYMFEFELVDTYFANSVGGLVALHILFGILSLAILESNTLYKD